MLRIYNEEIEIKQVNQTLRLIMKFFNEEVNYDNPRKYIIQEYFPIGKTNTYKPNVYKLYNLRMDIEDEMVFCDDEDGYLFQQMYDNTPLQLQAFCEDSVIHVQIHELENLITISFQDGYIKIKY